MRLTRLLLERYGHVSGEYLEFPPEQGLHVVLGANEAGKSTALEALADGLFGFPTRGRGRANHPDDPRVGFTLLGANGFEASFIRRKTGREKLSDAAGSAVPETALARFLGGMGRERFQEVFGLDGERLRRSGRAIMAEQGEAGAAILSARTGLRGLRETAARLDDEAKALFGDGRGQRRISVAAETIRTNRKLMAERSVSGADYLEARKRETDLLQASEGTEAERQALRAEQVKLSRVRATAPIRRELTEIEDLLAALGPAPVLPEDASARFEAAVASRDRSSRERRREEEEIASLEAALARLAPDPAILAEADAITALDRDLGRIADAKRDHLRVSGEADATYTMVEGHARRLGVTERGPALADRLPDLVTRRAAERLLTRYTADASAVRAAEAALQRARADAEDAGHALTALPTVTGAETLRGAVEEVRSAGPVSAELGKAATLRVRAEAEAERRLAQLALWRGDGAALEITSVPLEAEADRLGASLERAVDALRLADAAAAANEAAIEACRIAMVGIEAGRPLPTADAVENARTRRDAVWAELRRALAEEAAIDEELPDRLETLLREADALADARLAELARVQSWERHFAEKASLEGLRPGLEIERERARQTLAMASTTWQDAWRPAGIVPLGPAAMREWLRDRGATLTAIGAARDASAAHARLVDSEAALRARLLACLPVETPGDLASLLRDATQRLRQLDEAATGRIRATERVAAGAHAASEAQRICDAAQQRVRDWEGEWVPVAGRLGLPPGADPSVATEVLATWSEIETGLDRWRGFQGRLRDMRGAIDEHDSATEALARRLGLLASTTLATELARRLLSATRASAEQTRLQADRSAREKEKVGHARAEADAEADLEALRWAVSTSDDAGLRAAIEAAADRARLGQRRDERDCALRGLADGRTWAELTEEAAALALDGVPGRLEAINERLRALDGVAGERAGELVRVREQLRAMEAGNDVAGPTQLVQDSLAEIDDAADRYLRLRLAHALLRGGMDAYRRSQQGPLLKEAGTLFAALTGERYVRLEQDEGERGEPVIVAVRPDGSLCPATALSEGTTDQLFLALRLASIALEATGSEPMPFVADDLLVNFDDERAAAALRLLAEFGRTTQVILFTHHRHLLDLLQPDAASIHQLPRELAA